jgi:hypothetical protein
VISMRRSISSRDDFRFFFCLGRFVFFAPVATHVVLHHVSSRTLCEPLGSVPVEVQLEKSMLPDFGRPLTAQSRAQSPERRVVATENAI